MSWRDLVTPQEIEIVNEFKSRMINEATPGMLKDDTVFYRFCKARDFNLKQAEEMLRKHIAWRKEFQIDTILKDYKPPEVLKKYFPTSHIGFDKEGSPVRYVDIGGADNKGCIDSVKKIDFLRKSVADLEFDYELCKKQTEKLGKVVSRAVYIFNHTGLTFAKATHKRSIDLYLLGIKIYQDHYPERIKVSYNINVSPYFTVLFSILKRIILASIIEKSKFYGSDGWQEEFLKVIGAEELPAFLGGNKTDPDGDPLCSSFIVHGQNVPEKYYLRKSERRLASVAGIQKLNVSRFSKSDVEFDVQKEDSFLEWQFETKSKDIGFGLFHKSQNSNPLQLIPIQRIDTSYGPEVGMYRCETPGIYIMVFDNRYSWIYQKEIYFRARVTETCGEDNEDWD